MAYANKEAAGLRLSINGNTCVFTKEYDPTCLDTDVAGKLARRLVPDKARVKEGEVCIDGRPTGKGYGGCIWVCRHERRIWLMIKVGRGVARLGGDISWHSSCAPLGMTRVGLAYRSCSIGSGVDR